MFSMAALPRDLDPRTDCHSMAIDFREIDLSLRFPGEQDAAIRDRQ